MDDFTSSLYTHDWAKSHPAVILKKVLEGQSANLDWGDRNQYVFHKKMNVPVILVGKDKIPPAFYDSSFLKKMFVVRWEGKSPIGI